MKTRANNPNCRWLVMKDGNSVWVEERNFEDFPHIATGSNVVAAYTTKVEAISHVRALEREGYHWE